MYANGHAVYAAAGETAAPPIVIPRCGFIDYPEMDGKDRVKGRSQPNIAAFLNHAGVSLAWNEMSYRTVVRRSGQEVTLTDEVAENLWLEADAAGLPAALPYFVAVVGAIARRSAFHPIRDYLDSLEWDGVARLDTWLTLLGAEDTELNRAYGRKTLIGAVRRVRQPGAKHDTILVLQGPQGKGKSSAIRALCPNEDYFSDSLGIGDAQKEVIEATTGKWMIELAELSGMGKRDANAVKSMLSRMVDAARLSYGRIGTERPRQFILFGSVNEEQYLRDPTGNRRFWPVTIGGQLDPDEMRGHIERTRDRLWAEAAYYEALGESSTLPKHLWETAAESQRERLIADPWQERLEEELAGKTFIASADVYDLLGVATAQRNTGISQRIAGILAGMGFRRVQRRQEGGKRFWAYERGA